jgi:hypothetical protein
MARHPKIQHIFNLLCERVTGSEILAENCINYRERRSGGFRNLRRRTIYLITELAFLQIFLAWEDFLEESFVRYMCGGKAASGYRPNLYVSPSCLDHAYDILRGQKAFIEWSNAGEVLRRARLFFRDGEPYDPAIAGALQEFEEMRILRNGIAHHSATANGQFENLARALLGYRPRGLVPGLLLASVHSASGQTFLRRYSDIVKTVAAQIVP